MDEIMNKIKLSCVVIVFVLINNSVAASSCTCLYEDFEGWTQYIGYEVTGLGTESCCGPQMGNFSGWYSECSTCDVIFFSGSGGWTCMMVACCANNPVCQEPPI